MKGEMELQVLRINSTKLKITLTDEECEKYHIEEKGGEFDTTQLRGAISAILSELGDLDFNIDGEKLLVQLYPVKTGGAELFITKLSGVGERERRAIGRSENLNTYCTERAYFCFDSLSSLICASRVMSGKGIEADVYLTPDGEYILSVIDGRLDGLSMSDIFLEYSTRLPTNTALEVGEWYRPLRLGDALEMFARL